MHSLDIPSDHDAFCLDLLNKEGCIALTPEFMRTFADVLEKSRYRSLDVVTNSLSFKDTQANKPALTSEK